MEESIKNRIITILSVGLFIFFISAVNSCIDLQRQKYARDKETFARMELEEKLLKVESEKNKLADELKVLQESYKVTEETLAHQKQANKNLAEELEKMTKLKETLEEDLKEALTQRSSRRSR